MIDGRETQNWTGHGAVLTGDFVGSTEVGAQTLDMSFNVLTRCHEEISVFPIDQTALSRRAGDGWQMVLSDARYALRATALITARLKADTEALISRIAVGNGTVHLPANNDPNAGHGTAFTHSGRLLTDFPKNRRIAHAAPAEIGALFALADHVITGWTAAQAAAVAEMLIHDPGPRAAAAKRLGKSRQAVDQALHGAGFPALWTAITALEPDNAH